MLYSVMLPCSIREEAQRQYEEQKRKEHEKKEYQREKLRDNIRQKYGIAKKSEDGEKKDKEALQVGTELSYAVIDEQGSYG